MKFRQILKNVEKVFIALWSAVSLYFLFIISSLLLFRFENAEALSYILLAVAVLIEMTVVASLWGFLNKNTFKRFLYCAFAICIISACALFGHQAYLDNIQTVGESEDFFITYAPYADDTKAVSLDEKSELYLDNELPVMDGATALYPIYSSFAKAVYPKELLEDLVEQKGNLVSVKKSDYLKCSTTTYAYKNIVTGDADVIFAASPSAEQEQFAKDNGVELVYTPIGKEAFVFFVNAKNPIDNITIEEIQKIYSGETTQWSDLGVRNLGEIRAFQRDKGSGSQSTLEKLMAGKNLMAAPKEDVVDGMGGIIERTADYKNFKNSIGYSFRFYSTEMVKNNQIKLLSVNGVYPNLENIENGTYPLASYFYAVSRKGSDENTLKLLEWIQGEQGQKIIEMVGYTPLD